MWSILVVDDSSSLRTAVRIALNGAGFDVVEAEDGKQGLSKLDGRKYHLVISDVNMPRVDGETFLCRLAADKRLATVPVVMVSSDRTRDRAGRLLDRVASVFYNLTSSETGPELQAVQREMAAPMAAPFPPPAIAPMAAPIAAPAPTLAVSCARDASPCRVTVSV